MFQQDIHHALYPPFVRVSDTLAFLQALGPLCFINVVVQFYPWFKFYFPLFLGMLMYDNEFDTKENKI